MQVRRLAWCELHTRGGGDPGEIHMAVSGAGCSGHGQLLLGALTRNIPLTAWHPRQSMLLVHGGHAMGTAHLSKTFLQLVLLGCRVGVPVPVVANTCQVRCCGWCCWPPGRPCKAWKEIAVHILVQLLAKQAGKTAPHGAWLPWSCWGR
jgi:hypothetical protein